VISDLRVLAPVGVLAEEHGRLQPLSIDCELEVDLTKAGASDALDDTVNYADVAEGAVAIIQARHHELLESLGDEIGRFALSIDARIESATVTIRKLQPPLDLEVAWVGIVRTVRR
jgi:dihydroneopterin aldolase